MRVALLALLAACTSPKDGDTGEGPVCAGGILDPADFAVTVSPTVGSVVSLDVVVTGTADVTVMLEAPGVPSVQPPTWTGISGTATLPIYGLRPDTTYTAHVEASADRTCDMADVTVTTGSLPATLPRVTLLEDGDPWGAYTLFGWIDNEDASRTGAVIVDDGGSVVWAWIAPLGVAANASWVEDGSGDVIVRSDDRADPTLSAFYRVSMEGELLEETERPDAHHEIGQAPDIAYAYLRAVSREVDGEAITGDEIVEVGLDGTERVAWNAFDCLPAIEQHQAWTVDTAPIPGRDWTHANGLSYCAADDTWLVSLYYLREIHKIRRSDCSTVWEVDGNASSGRGYVLPAAEDAFGPQHAPRCTDDGVVFFDNGTSERGYARGMKLVFDDAAGTASSAWTVPHPDAAYTPLLGATAILPDGSTAFGWGALGDVTVSDATGAITWRIDVQGATLGSVARRETLYGN